MRVVVCVKHVPDLQSDRGFTADGLVDRGQGDGTLNELDENAVEAALQLVEEHGGEVCVLTLGPDDAEDAVRRGMQMGATRALHVLDDAAAGSDVFGTARVLAAAVRHLEADGGPFDLVVTGMAALDGLTSLLPAALAAELDLPQLTLATEFEVVGETVQVRRVLDHATEVLSARMPALVSVTDASNEPRYPNFAGIRAARKRTVEVVALADLGVDPETVGTAGARTQVLGTTPRPVRENRVLIADEGDAGLRLAAFLVENKLV